MKGAASITVTFADGSHSNASVASSQADKDIAVLHADRTGATYYPAESSDHLKSVFAGLPTNLVTKHDVVELSAVFLAAGAAIAAVAYLLARAWRPLPAR